jgi:hypothetical protein
MSRGDGRRARDHERTTVSAFSGPVAEFCARFRRGHPDAVVDRPAAALGPTGPV